MQQLTGKRYCVTGGAGFIGSHIAEEICKQGKQVVVIDDLTNGRLENFEGWWDDSLCTFKQRSITKWDRLRLTISKCDGVFHNAVSKAVNCSDFPYEDLDVNALGSLRVFRAAAQAKNCKVVYASTGSVMGGKPVTYYGVTKYAAELYLHALKQTYFPDLEYTILRYFQVYGPRQWNDMGGVVQIFLRRMFECVPCNIEGTGKQIRPFTYVKDIVKANLWSMENGVTNGRMYNVAGPESISVKDVHDVLAKIYKKVVGVPCRANTYGPPRPGDIPIVSGDITPLLNDGFVFDWNLETGFAKTWSYYYEQLFR